MSFVNKNLGKPSLVKPIASVIAVLLLVGGIYTFFGSKKSESVKEEVKKEDSSELDIMGGGVKPSGLDLDERVKNVEDVEKVVAKWIEANPHIVIQSVNNMQKKAAEDRLKNSQKNIVTKKDEIFNDATSANYSPEGYDVELVEFFDYACGYCKKAQATVDELLKSDKKIKIIYKEFPILGQPSLEMSQVSIAVNMAYPESYKKFHDALMKTNERGKAAALKAVKSVGLNSAKVEEILKNQKDKIDSVIQANLALGNSVGINGTPGFIIGEELIPGALDLPSLKQKVSAVRASK
ncbi:MAG: DsbA family protein [Proteobacteria bacterium]|nr:DsbA family protein [Pseudomonadota bacterium]